MKGKGDMDTAVDEVVKTAEQLIGQAKDKMEGGVE